MLIPEEDRKEFNDLDEFIFANINGYVSMNIPATYMQYRVAFINIDNYKGDLPVDIGSIISISGVGEEKKKRLVYKEQILGVMRRASENCTYTVYKSCECPDKESNTCEHDIILAADALAHEASVGEDNFLVKHTYGYSDQEDGAGNVYMPQIKLMRPRSSSYMHRHVKGAINYNIPENKYSKYEYEIFNNVIDTNIKEGLLVFAYKSNLKRKDGMYGVPYVEAFIDAVKAKALSEAYAHLARIRQTNLAERSAQREHARFIEKHLIGRRELYRLPYGELVLAISKNKHHHFKAKSYRSGIESVYPDNVQLCLNDTFTY